GGSMAAIIRPLSHSAAAGSTASWSTPSWAAFAQVEPGSSPSRTTRMRSARSVTGASLTSSPRRMREADCHPPESGGRTVSITPRLSATRAHSSVIAPRSVMRATCMCRACRGPRCEHQIRVGPCGYDGEGAPPVSSSHRRRPFRCTWVVAPGQRRCSSRACAGCGACPHRLARAVSTAATFESVLTGSTAPGRSVALHPFVLPQYPCLPVGAPALEPGSVVLEAEITVAGVDRAHRQSCGRVDGLARYGHGEPERLDDGATGVLTVVL